MTPFVDQVVATGAFLPTPMTSGFRPRVRTEGTAVRPLYEAAGAVVALLVIVLPISGCDDRPTAPERLTAGREAVLLEGWWLYGATEVEARPMWRVQYRSAAAFLDLEPRIDRVRWFVADSILGKAGVYRATGVWLEPHTIVIARGFVEALSTVCHESLHELLQTTGHDHVAFGRCPFGT